MLLELHVKNFALIDDADVSFSEGLQIFTGETGAGKTLLIEAINAALGVKTSAQMIRRDCDHAEIELVFCVENPKIADELSLLDAMPDEEGVIIIGKTIFRGRSLNRINDRTVTSAKLKEVTSRLVHIHGQNEHQFLFHKSEHLRILDAFCRQQSMPLKERVSELYSKYSSKKKELSELDIDESARLRETDLLRYEIKEIELAQMKAGEEDELEAEWKKMQNARKLAENLNEAKELLSSDSYDCASERIGKAVKALQIATEYDPNLSKAHELSLTVESLVFDLASDVNSYLDSLSFSEEDHRRVEERLDQIRNIEAKYGSTYDAVMAALDERAERLKLLEDLEQKKADGENELSDIIKQLETASKALSDLRKEQAKELAEVIKRHLIDLNFLDVRFTVELKKISEYSANGYDEVEFYIATNPGEELLPLAQVASGGELSRVMLAVKTALADADDIETLIFDEIDAGISGRTAQKVSEKLALIAKKRQVICITHLAQIAAMADKHFRIEKRIADGKTSTYVTSLDAKQMVEELARIQGGVSVTEAVIKQAAEMKELALAHKAGI